MKTHFTNGGSCGQILASPKTFTHNRAPSYAKKYTSTYYKNLFSHQICSPKSRPSIASFFIFAASFNHRQSTRAMRAFFWQS